MVTRAGGVGTDDILALTVTPAQTERGPRNEADREQFLVRISRALVMLKYEGKSHSLVPNRKTSTTVLILNVLFYTPLLIFRC